MLFIRKFPKIIISVLILLFIFHGCDDDTANDLGIGAQCSNDSDCTEDGQECLSDFKGGYCGVQGCQSSNECPDGSQCVVYTFADNSSENFCFLVCTTKADCNENRDEDNEANCSANITLADQSEDESKACVPPSG